MGQTKGVDITGSLSMILPEIQSLIETSRHHVAVTANLALVNLYWQIGRIITEDINKNAKRAEYGAQLIEKLSESLRKMYGRGYSSSNLQDMRRFFETFRICQPLVNEFVAPPILQPVAGQSDAPEIFQPPAGESDPDNRSKASEDGITERIPIDFKRHYHLGWTHYRILLGIPDPLKRRFYFERATSGRWSKREIQRQIEGALFERVHLSRDTRKLVALEKKKGAPEIVRYEDIFKDPYLLDFLGLKGAYSEKDLEAAIIRNLEDFISELGSDFCFIGRQYPMRIDDVDYYLDLLFFHRGLRCLVAIELKLGTFNAADKGQMDFYLAWLKEREWRDGENEPVGLILCSSKKKQHVELLLRHGPHRMQVSEYLTKLPDRKVLETRLKLYSKLLDQE
ncbi:MAG TPA: PDDEXK nuclease domain-containing protein [Syntrophales bacterium]|nr:PDDEXK nuclease domain-containing protein [Syntrophales bacterium]